MLTFPDEDAFGALGALEVAARCFEDSPVQHLTPRLVAMLLRALSEQICTPEQIAAFKIAHDPEALHALEGLEQDLKMRKVKPC